MADNWETVAILGRKVLKCSLDGLLAQLLFLCDSTAVPRSFCLLADHQGLSLYVLC